MTTLEGGCACGGVASAGFRSPEAERAVDACLPVKVTPSLGAAVEGRMFTITLGRERPAPGA